MFLYATYHGHGFHSVKLPQAITQGGRDAWMVGMLDDVPKRFRILLDDGAWDEDRSM